MKEIKKPKLNPKHQAIKLALMDIRTQLLDGRGNTIEKRSIEAILLRPDLKKKNGNAQFTKSTASQNASRICMNLIGDKTPVSMKHVPCTHYIFKDKKGAIAAIDNLLSDGRSSSFNYVHEPSPTDDPLLTRLMKVREAELAATDKAIEANRAQYDTLSAKRSLILEKIEGLKLQNM